MPEDGGREKLTEDLREYHEVFDTEHAHPPIPCELVSGGALAHTTVLDLSARHRQQHASTAEDRYVGE
jgi:hypothetical protein